MTTTGTLGLGFTARCDTCKKMFDDEAADTIQELTADMIKAKWQVFPTCCAECVKKLGVWYTDDRPKDQDKARAENDKPTKKVAGDDTRPVRRRVRRRLL